MKLQGKVAIVTGAATGIGKAIATGMAAEGAAVVVDYVGKDDVANGVVETIRSAGGKALAIEADISNPDQVNALVRQTVQAMGRIDIFVNNAGMESKHPFTEYPFDLAESDCGRSDRAISVRPGCSQSHDPARKRRSHR
jgi:NAD(P)-dependent dehydrogenase (short-subunit alcohol dehydrogenase family)